MGPDPYLSSEEEKIIAEWCADISKCGFPLKQDDLLNTVQRIIKDTKRETPFKDGRPGRTWLRAFFKRNPSLAAREAESITKGRAVVTEELILKWFRKLEDYLKSIGQQDILTDPARILNGDETSFQLCPKTGKVIAPRGYKNVYQIHAGNDKETLTVLIVFSADGKMLPPMVVFPYLRPPKDIVQSMPANWFLGRTESGWMRSETFFEYVANGVDGWLEEQNVPRPVILFVDGHKSHLTLELSEWCNKKNIILYALPPNTTHMMQPADVSVFKPLKSDWKKTVREWQSENIGQVLTKKTFCPLLEATILRNVNMETTIKNGFRKCGLHPFDPKAVDFTKCVKNMAENVTAAQTCRKTSTAQERIPVQKFNNALEVIELLAQTLKDRNINVDVVLDTIKQASTEGVPALNIAFNDLTMGTYDLNEDGTLQLACSSTTADELFTVILESDTQIASPTPGLSRESPKPGCSRKSPTPSPYASLPTIGTPRSSLSRRSSTSSIIGKHLFYPKIVSYGGKTRVKREGIDRSPSAISSEAWREIFAKKEKNKQDKIDAINKRKEERLLKKKTNLKTKQQKLIKNKEKCDNCSEELQSDIEDDDLKNIGCDSCTKWFHLKCTPMCHLTYLEASQKDFMCLNCLKPN